jgi:hypothetical protein
MAAESIVKSPSEALYFSLASIGQMKMQSAAFVWYRGATSH